MRSVGFQMVNLSGGIVVDGHLHPAPWRTPRGVSGEGYMRAMRLREAERRASGIEWTKEQRGRDDWPRTWKWIEPLFGDCDPKTVAPEQFVGDPNRPDVKGLREVVAIKVSGKRGAPRRQGGRQLEKDGFVWRPRARSGASVTTSRTPPRSHAPRYGVRAKRFAW